MKGTNEMIGGVVRRRKGPWSVQGSRARAALKILKIQHKKSKGFFSIFYFSVGEEEEENKNFLVLALPVVRLRPLGCRDCLTGRGGG